MRQRWMRIIESGSDRDIGAALVRLAQQAAEAHRAELAASAESSADEAAPDACLAGASAADDPHRPSTEPER